MLHVPSVLQRCSLGECSTILIFDILTFVERALPTAICQARSCAESLLIVDILEILRSLIKVVCKVALSQHLGHLGCSIVVVGIFQCLGDCLRRNNTLRIVAIFDIVLPIALLVRLGLRPTNQIHCPLAIVVAKTLAPRLDNDGYGVVANHTMGFIAPQCPYRQITLCIALLEHRDDKVVDTLGCNNRIERMRCTIGIP